MSRLALRLFAAVIVAISLVGCGQESPDALLKSAQERIAKRDRAGAIILLKNALQKNPELAAARFFLGKMLLETGKPREAYVELRKAADLRYSADEVYPQIMLSWIAIGEFDKVVEEVPKAGVISADSRSQLYSYLAIAHLALSNLDKAAEAVATAYSAQSESTLVLLTRGSVKAARGEVESALRDIEAVIAKEPSNEGAHKARGDLLAASGKFVEATSSYKKALELKPDFLIARSALLVMLVQGGSSDEARAQVEEMRKHSPNDPRVLFYSALQAFSQNDFVRARDECLKLLQKTSGNAASLQLAGAIEFKLGAFAQAESYLLRAVQADSNSTSARRWLAQTYMATGQLQRASQVLDPVLNRLDKDTSALSLAGEIRMRLGDIQKGEELFRKAAQINPKDLSNRTALALVRVVRGDDAAALLELGQISAEDTGTTADMALISTALRKNDFARALKAVDSVDRKRPNEPSTYTLRARILLAAGDSDGARKNLEKALAISPAFYPAAEALGGLDAKAKDLASAQRRFEDVLKADPRSTPALRSLAKLKAELKAPPEQVVELFNRAISSAPTSPEARLELAQYHLTRGDAKKAVATAQEGLAATRDDPGLLDTLGRAQFTAGERNQALATFAKLASVTPSSPMAYLRMSDVQVAAQDYEAAATSLRKAIEIAPDLTAARMGLISLKLREDKVSDARSIARNIQRENPNVTVGYLLEGDISAARGSFDEAVSAYRAGLKQVPTSIELAKKIFGALTAAGKAAEARNFAESWIRQNPKDAGFKLYVADRELIAGKYAEALARYRELLPQFGEIATMLNNMAEAARMLKLPEAMSYAEKANKLAPNQPAFMDTMAMLLAEKGNLNGALDLLAKASVAAPELPSIKLNYARVLAQAGRKEEARKEYEALAKLGNQYKFQAEVARALREL